MTINMQIYSFHQLLLFFYVYGVLGWIYESILVSVTSKKLVNRGFVKGPILPIYGLGATIILFFTGPFEDYPVAVFFIGMISATILEYVSGYLLEKIFKVRYWDYTGDFGSIKGYICLASVLMWGFFSLFTVYFLHRDIVEKIINTIPNLIIYLLLIIVSVVFIIDLYYSLKEAYNIKNIHEKLEALYNEVKNTDFAEKFEIRKKEFYDIIEKSAEKRHTLIKRNPKAMISKKYRDILNELKKLM